MDIDVPLFLPIYGQRRQHDLRRIAVREIRENFRIDGQVNFDSGWEWGYWLSDVVTARAAWDPHLGEEGSAGGVGCVGCDTDDNSCAVKNAGSCGAGRDVGAEMGGPGGEGSFDKTDAQCCNRDRQEQCKAQSNTYSG